MSTPAAAIHEPGPYIPPDLPIEFHAFDTPVRGLDAASTTKLGLMDLELAPSGGATRIVRQSLHGPLYVLRPIYTDPNRPDMAFIYALQMGDGMVQGDRYRIDLTCTPGAAAHFTTQAATKLYRMEDNFATQMVELSVGPGAYLEYLPDPVIPFRGSRYFQRLRLTADPEATVVLGEILLPGRVARGELHAYTIYYSDLEARSPEGDLLFADRISFNPGIESPKSPGRLGPYDILANLYIVTRKIPARELGGRLHQRLSEQDVVLAGVSALPNECGVAVRLLGHASPYVRAVFRTAWDEARRLLIGVPAPDLRKG